MIQRLLIFVFFLSIGEIIYAQNCNEQVVSDSIFKPADNKKFPAKVLTSSLKNGGKIQLIDINGKFLLKLYMNEKLGLNETGPLEIKSGSRSFFIKNVTMYDIKEQNPYFLIDVFINYIGTLKDDGITSVVFNTKFESKLTKEDMTLIKKMAKCFYELHKK